MLPVTVGAVLQAGAFASPYGCEAVDGTIALRTESYYVAHDLLTPRWPPAVPSSAVCQAVRGPAKFRAYREAPDVEWSVFQVEHDLGDGRVILSDRFGG